MKQMRVIFGFLLFVFFSCRSSCLSVDRPPPMVGYHSDREQIVLNPQIRVIDLTHPLEPGIPVYPGSPQFLIEPVALLAKDGYYVNKFTMGEHTGTHVDAPCHFVVGRCVDQIPLKTLFGPAVVISRRMKVRPMDEDLQRADWSQFSLTIDHVTSWESKNGQIPPGAVVFLETGWSDFWPGALYVNLKEGKPNFPAYMKATAEWLVKERGVVALGIDTLSTDPGNSTTFDEHKLVLALGAYHIENVANLHLLPATGAWVVVAPLPIKGGSGAPARVLAFLPPEK